MALTRTDGPLSAKAPDTVNYRIDGPAHKLLMHPFPRRVRAELAGRTVLDTRRGVLVHETALLPRLYVPEDDIDQSLVRPERPHHALPVQGRRDLPHAAGGRPGRGERAVGLPGPAARGEVARRVRVAVLGGRRRLVRRGRAGVRAPHRPVHPRRRAADVSRHVRVLAGDTVVAESHHPLVLDETGLPARWYLSPDDVRVPLEPTATRTRCPYKGEARLLVGAAAGRPRAHRRRRGPTRTRCPSRRGSPGG